VGRWSSPSEAGRSSPRGGLGYLLSQQLVAAGEAVFDVPATLASRVRVLAPGRSNKNDPNGCDLRGGGGAALARTSSG